MRHKLINSILENIVTLKGENHTNNHNVKVEEANVTDH
jgi:hypothetical protein